MISFIPTNPKNYNSNCLSSQDKKSCVVHAISNAFDISYNEAFKFSEKIYNRKLKSGVMSFIFVGRNNMISNHRLSYYGKRMKIIENKPKSRVYENS
jgi:hypothetical protein